jgi:hypothetical protein
MLPASVSSLTELLMFLDEFSITNPTGAGLELNPAAMLRNQSELWYGLE